MIFSMVSSDESDGDKVRLVEDVITKKVCLKEQGIETDVGMAMDLNPDPPLSWKERLMGKGSVEVKNEMCNEDYEKILCQGPWVIYGQYLMVQPWTIDFNPAQSFPSFVMSWICFPGLPSHMYNPKILWEIGAMMGKLVKLDFKTNFGARGRFARMAVSVNLDKPLYEDLPMVYFLCGRYGHVKDLCPKEETAPRVDGKGSSNGGGTLGTDAVMVEDDGMNEGGRLCRREMIKRCSDKGLKDINSMLEMIGKNLGRPVQWAFVIKREQWAHFQKFIGKRWPRLMIWGLRVAVALKEDVLDPLKHSAMVFKENANMNQLEGLDSNRVEVLDGVERSTQGRFVKSKADGAKNGMKLNKTIRDRGNQFKISSNKGVLISDSIDNMVNSM
ncbi:hypothetical protein GOBAR_AA01028 [Gossypium barbadense]|uniref:Uncharacterized protein n=1 Tax=Gossypium barbadense TaxID=3634 RepID=A0A2P5YVD1_GOSBA|nr:hypothetical protein GOBAR_AA01028 [Gossypium barbadense]